MSKESETQKLLKWCKRNTETFPGVKVSNFTSSWGDGLAFGALIANWRPDILDFDTFAPDRSDKVAVLTVAFKARDQLGIMDVLDAVDVADYQEQKSIQTQLAEYYKVLSKSPAKGYKDALINAHDDVDVEDSTKASTAEISLQKSLKLTTTLKSNDPAKAVAKVATAVSSSKSFENKEVGSAKVAAGAAKTAETGDVLDHNGNKIYGIDADLFLKQESKRDKDWERKVMLWVQEALEEPLVDVDNVYLSLRTGVELCKLLNKLKPGTIKKFASGKLNVLSERQNIEDFLKAIAALGVPNKDICACGDLHSQKNPGAMVTTLYALHRVACNTLEWTGTVVPPQPTPLTPAAKAAKAAKEAEAKKKAEEAAKGDSNAQIKVEAKAETKAPAATASPAAAGPARPCSGR